MEEREKKRVTLVWLTCGPTPTTGSRTCPSSPSLPAAGGEGWGEEVPCWRAQTADEETDFFSSTRLLSPALSSILNGGEGEEARRMQACCIHTCHRIQYPHAPRAAHLLPLRHWRSACWGLPSKTATLSRSHAPRSPAPRERSGGRGRLVQLFADGLGQFLQVEGFREEGRPFAQGDILASNLRTIAAHINNL